MAGVNSYDIFVQGGSAFSPKDWDDSALIEAYDRAMDAVKDKKAADKKINKINSRVYDKSRIKWKVGDYCEALFSKDKFLYEAEIIAVDETKTKCSVMFLGYDNVEEVDYEFIYPSQGKGARARQLANAKKEIEGKWNVGDKCLAPFSEDGLFYEAEIIEIYFDEGACLVRYDEYNNEEDVYMQELQCVPTDHSDSRKKKEKSHGKSISSIDDSSSSFSSERSSISGHRRRPADLLRSHSAPSPSHRRRRNNHRDDSQNYSTHPFPQFFPTNSPMPIPFDGDVSEELGPMLMSWYMAGFHTGYYQGRTSRLGGCNMPPPHRGAIP